MLAKTCDIGSIVTAARTLWERLENPPGDPASLEEIANRLALWREALQISDDKLLDKRLEWDGIDQVALAFAVAGADYRGPAGKGDWTDTLSAIISGDAEEEHPLSECGSLAALVSTIRALPRNGAFRADKPLPFEDVWIPVLAVARHKLVGRLSCSDSRNGIACPVEITRAAYADLERDLLARLVMIGEQVLYKEFRRERSPAQELRLLFVGSRQETERRVYDAFVGRQTGDRLYSLFRAYPVLARLVAVAVDQWVEAAGEFIERLLLDADDIALSFGSREAELDPGSQKIVSLRPGLSDPHNGGRKVIAAHFGSGHAIVYKPKPLATETAFNRFLAWCNGRFQSDDFRVLRCIDRGPYGWVEFVEHAPCRTADEVRRFYERTGSLLCVLHCLRVTDGHRENLIASGAFPVFVDGETVIHAEGYAGDRFGDREEANFQESVLRTGLLPRWLINSQQRLVLDISALGGSDRDQIRRAVWRWDRINTDAMHRKPDEIGLQQSESDTSLDGAPASPPDHAEDIVRGFAETYRDLMWNRDALLDAEGPIASFRGLPIRFVFRPTVVYMSILHGALSPDSLTDGVSRSISLDAVSRAFLGEPRQPEAWAIVRAERHALELMDVPCFVAPCGSRDLPLYDGGHVAGFFPGSNIDQVIDRITAMSEIDLDLQCMVIRGSFMARSFVADTTHAVPTPETHVTLADSALTRDQLLDEARAIAEQVCASAHRAADGALWWMGFHEIEGTSRYQFHPIGDDLYHGSSGIALFLAALAQVDGSPAFRDRALAALAPLRARLATARAGHAFLGAGPIGGATGLGSVVYALANIGAWLGEEPVLSDARKATELLTDERIQNDTLHDVMGGAAGAILSLLAVERTSGSGMALERAATCGRRLLDCRIAPDGADGGWLNPNGLPLTGFSHGAAGIAYALLRLQAATGDNAFLDAAQEAIDYERRVFDAEASNWPDFRGYLEGDERRFGMSWCHGAPGIALARLGALDVLDGNEVRAEVETGLKAVCACGAGGFDLMCCGTMGRIETLAVAADRLDRDDLRAIAQSTAAAVVRRAQEAGGYRLAGGAAGSLFPDLFCGLPGIGYQLLRLGFPERVPSVLLWH